MTESDGVRNRAVALLLVGAFCSACSDSVTVLELPAEDAHSIPAPEPLTSKDSAWVFAEEQVRTYELEVDPGQWMNLQAHALDEQYERALLRVDGIPVGEVGLRYKGSTGTLRRCARAGQLVCSKLSMKLKFDEYDPALRYFGLKRINFNSMLSDSTLLHERLAYGLFRQMGVTAPRAVHARLRVNDEDLGLFSLVESIDGRFTDLHLPGGDGNLYKEHWPSSDELGRLDQRLKTNEEAPDHDRMIEFQHDLARAAPDDLPAVVARYMDIDNLLAYIAVDHTIVNWDGITAFYCNGGRCRNHNYYVYQHESEARFTLIPWDLDNTFNLYNSFDRVPGPREIPADCSLRYLAVGGLEALAPACDPLLQGAARTPSSRYRAQLARLLEGPLDIPTLDAWLDERVAQLLPFVAEDASGPSPIEFQTHVEALRRDLRLLERRVRAEHDGDGVQKFRLEPDRVNDFETATPLGVALGVPALSALGTQFQVGLAPSAGPGGQAELELGFEFRDAGEPWAHWLRFTLPFRSRTDLNLKSGVRLVLEADAPRTVRIGILSSNYSRFPSATTSTLGWDVPLDGTRQTIELRLAEASFPAWESSLPDVPSDVLADGRALLIDPLVRGQNTDGYLGPDIVDAGRIRIDDVQLLPESMP